MRTTTSAHPTSVTGAAGEASTDDLSTGARRLPAGFTFGVSDSGFQSEGGYNGPGQPANNWAAWERSGKAEPAGIANQFWDRYAEHFARAAGLGCDAYRLGVEWTRCVPAPDTLDLAAIERYVDILRAATDAGLEPVVALHHFTHPEWLGSDLWLRPDAPERFAEWAELIVPFLAPHCRRFTTINEINALGIGSYLIGYFPPGKRLRPDLMLRAIDAMLAAHVRAYDIVHRHRPDAQVGTSTYAFWPYDADRLLVDLLAARSAGVARADVDDWIAERRRTFHRAVVGDQSPIYRAWQHGIGAGLRALLRPAGRFPRTLDAVYTSPHESTVDVVQVNYYDPNLSNYMSRPGRVTGGRRHWGPDPEHWEQKPGPEHFATYLEASALPGRPTWVLENGLCSPVVDGVAHQRDDGWDRPTYLAAHLDAVADAVARGVDVTGYFTWSLFDNYQWGEHSSRFGLHAVERHGDRCTFLGHDAMGDDAAGAYRRLIAAHRPAADASPGVGPGLATGRAAPAAVPVAAAPH